MIDHLELTTENFEAMCTFYGTALQVRGYTRITGGPPAGFGTPYAPPIWLRPGVTPRPNVPYEIRSQTRALVDAESARSLKAMSSLRQFQQGYLVTGDVDFMLGVLARDMLDFEAFAQQALY